MRISAIDFSEPRNVASLMPLFSEPVPSSAFSRKEGYHQFELASFRHLAKRFDTSIGIVQRCALAYQKVFTGTAVSRRFLYFGRVQSQAYQTISIGTRVLIYGRPAHYFPCCPKSYESRSKSKLVLAPTRSLSYNKRGDYWAADEAERNTLRRRAELVEFALFWNGPPLSTGARSSPEWCRVSV